MYLLTALRAALCAVLIRGIYPGFVGTIHEEPARTPSFRDRGSGQFDRVGAGDRSQAFGRDSRRVVVWEIASAIVRTVPTATRR